MKKIISLLLALVLVLGLAACGGSTEGEQGAQAGAETTAAAANGGFRVGYGKEDITPEGQVGMGGYGRSDQRLSTGVLSYLYATCIAITDADDNTILLYGLDLCGAVEASNFRTQVSEATGVPVDNIVMSASHTHSAPDYGTTAPGTGAALNKLRDGLVDAGVAAMEDRKSAQMFGGSVETEGMNFVRHYVCNDGSYCGDNFGDSSSGYAGHATDADNVVQAIKFTREGDKDIYLTNFQTHPHQTGGSSKYDLSADIVGEYRLNMEKDLDCEVLYFSGAGGNINSRSRIAEENQTKDFREWGKRMAKYVQSIEFTPLQTGAVKATKGEFSAKINHEFDSLSVICGDLRNRWDKGEISTQEVIEIGASYGIKLNSPYHAGAIRSRASMGPSSEFEIWALSFGDVGFVAFPGEQFDTNGKFIKDNSPFEMTIVATLANGSNGYFPSVFTFEHGSYEVDTTKYVSGTAERLADEYVNMLGQLHGE